MFLPIFACLFGCGVQTSVAIDASAAPDAKAETHFVMVASDPNVRPTNPDFIAITRAVARALASQGFEQAKSQDQSDLVVVIDWMVSDPKVVARHALQGQGAIVGQLRPVLGFQAEAEAGGVVGAADRVARLSRRGAPH